MEKRRYVQYGCGLSAPKEWINFDASPTLKIQKMPILGSLIKPKLNVVFPSNVKYGDIIKGLPIAHNSCDGVYCSHTLEHLALNEFRAALNNTFDILKEGGIFRCIVPDLEWAAREYVNGLNEKSENASFDFMELTLLGFKQRPKGLRGLIKSFFGNSNHLWMWDQYSLAAELRKAGFKIIRNCSFNDSQDEMFKLVEEKGRFNKAVAIECVK
ncbi:MAG: methyltransferase type 11 [Flavobacteriales bacterium]|nr:methyltransferase type 11 [Flavobacteriales bacterium]